MSWLFISWSWKSFWSVCKRDNKIRLCILKKLNEKKSQSEKYIKIIKNKRKTRNWEWIRRKMNTLDNEKRRQLLKCENKKIENIKKYHPLISKKTQKTHKWWAICRKITIIHRNQSHINRKSKTKPLFFYLSIKN